MPFANDEPQKKKYKTSTRKIEDEINKCGWNLTDGMEIKYIDNESVLVDYGAKWER